MTSAPRGASPYRVARAGKAFRWPGGKRVAVVFNIAYEGWSDGEAPGIGPMGNVLKPGFFDTNARSWSDYGAVRGLARLLRIAQTNKIATSVMTNGVLAARAPDSVRRIRDEGHEIVAHSWGMDVIPVYLDETAERANLARTTRAIMDGLRRDAERGGFRRAAREVPSLPRCSRKRAIAGTATATTTICRR